MCMRLVTSHSLSKVTSWLSRRKMNKRVKDECDVWWRIRLFIFRRVKSFLQSQRMERLYGRGSPPPTRHV